MRKIRESNPCYPKVGHSFQDWHIWSLCQSSILSGRGGIRTHGTVTFNSFQDYRHRPLGHPSIEPISRIELECAGYESAIITDYMILAFLRKERVTIPLGCYANLSLANWSLTFRAPFHVIHDGMVSSIYTNLKFLLSTY